MRPALLLLSLSGCWVSPDEVDAVLDPGSVVTGDIEIAGVDPDWGTTAGGVAIAIEASPVQADARVWFGDAEADVVSVEDGLILLTSPEGVAGAVDVRVESGSDAGLLPEGFTYWEDAQGTVGLVGEHSWFEPVGYLADEPPWGSTWLLFHEPGEVDLRGYFGPPLDTCQRDWDWSPTLVEVPLGATEVSLRGDSGHTFALEGEPTGGWFEREEPSSADWQARESYDLLEIEGDWPPFGVQALAHTPGELTVYTPNLESTLPAVSINTSLAWSTADSGDYVVAYLLRYEGGDDPVDRVTCTMADDGAFQVPGTVWTSWSFLYTDFLVMYLGRVQVTETTLPHTRASALVAGSHWVVGAAVQGI